MHWPYFELLNGPMAILIINMLVLGAVVPAETAAAATATVLLGLTPLPLLLLPLPLQRIATSFTTLIFAAASYFCHPITMHA